MMPASIIVSPQVLIDRNKPYSTIQTIELSTANNNTTKTITVPDDILVTSMYASVWAQDIDDKSYAIIEDDVERDIYTVRIKVVGRTDYSDAPQDVFNFNKQSNGLGFQGFILPRNTDIQITVGHASNGTPINDPTYIFKVELNGYVAIAEKAIRPDSFNPPNTYR
jgi:hypothetical protein